MSTTTLQPYLFFAGTCREAMEFYHTVFGGELTVQTMGEAGEDTSAERKDRVMHAYLTGGAVTLMASDSDRDHFETSCISLSLNGSNEAELRTLFDTLAQGGSQIQPITKESWGSLFGSLTDKFGIDWMVNIDPAS